MTSRDRRIVDAALAHFFRYGIKRTSLTDIAKEAEVSRQTIYNSYGDKDGLLRATIATFAEDLRTQTRAALQNAHTLEARLDAFNEHMVIAMWEYGHSNPDAADLLEGATRVAQQEITAANREMRGLIAETFEPERDKIAGMGLTQEAFSEVLQTSFFGLKNEATSREDLDRRLDALKRLTLAALG